MSCWPPSPRDRLSRSSTAGTSPPATTTRPPPPSRALDSERRVFSPRPDWRRGRDERSRRMVPTFTRSWIGQGGAQLYSGNSATATPQTFTMAIDSLPTAGTRQLRSRYPHRSVVRYKPAHIHRVGAGFAVTEHPALGRLHYTFYLAQRARTVWQYRRGAPSRGRLPPVTIVPGDRLHRRFIRPLRRPNRDGLSPPIDTPGASWRTVPPRRRWCRLRISLARFSSRFSARNRRSSSAISVVTPGRLPVSTWSLRTQLNNVCAVPIPSLARSTPLLPTLPQLSQLRGAPCLTLLFVLPPLLARAPVNSV